MPGKPGGNGPSRNLSVRLTATHLNVVSALAQVDGITMGEVIRHAIDSYGELRRKDPEFKSQVERAKAQLDAVLIDG